MDQASGFRPDQSHVPQQSRRDKLRVQQLQSNPHHLHHHNFPNNLDQFSLHGHHPADHIVHARNARHASNFLYDVPSGIIPSEMLDFSSRNSASHNNVLVRNSVSEWRSPSQQLNPQYQSFDWFANFAEANNLINPTSTGHQMSAQVMNLAPPYNNNDILEDPSNIVTVASTGPRNQQDMMEISNDVRDHQNELALLPLSYVNQSKTTPRFDNVQDHHHGLISTTHSSTVVSDSNNLQGLSLSLSSINPQFQGSEVLELPKPAIPKPSIISKANCAGKSLQDIVGVSSCGYRSTTGPLGPFTGYATILKSSRFLWPAQQLLDDFCGSKVLMMVKSTSTCDVDNISAEMVSGEVSGSANSGDHDHGDHINVNESDQIVAKKASNNNNNSCGSSSTFYGSNDHHGGVGSSVSFGSSRPEQAQQKKAKLLYMQEEVSRKYKQYRQQMQMVVSSFQSVAGLSSATPYIFMALKTVSRHFRCLKGGIADQLKHTRKALGEDLPSPMIGSSIKLGHDHHAISTVRLKYMEQSFQKHKSGGANMAFPEPQQHIWRPQRGLPERSVAILRAWLFEHFLHPYPTDTDKHMLATQTGLTRNQVSNWFINARVRVWKPMVEEIHTLESKGLADQVDKSTGKHESIPASNDQASTKLGTSVVPSKPLECSGADYSTGNRDHRLGAGQQQSQEKRLRLECQVPTSMSGTLMGFIPYHRSGLEVWGHGHQ